MMRAFEQMRISRQLAVLTAIVLAIVYLYNFVTLRRTQGLGRRISRNP